MARLEADAEGLEGGAKKDVTEAAGTDDLSRLEAISKRLQEIDAAGAEARAASLLSGALPSRFPTLFLASSRLLPTSLHSVSLPSSCLLPPF